MELTSIATNHEYILCDSNLRIIKFSDGAQKYADQVLIIQGDIRNSFPEVVGLEATCIEILQGQQQRFFLESICRSNQLVYFDLLIKTCDDYLMFQVTDVTATTEMQQLSVQHLNEAEISLNKLQRFEYCTNKIIASMRDVLLITSPQGKIERVNKSSIEIFQQRKSKLLNQSINNLIQDPNFNHQEIYSCLLNFQDSVKKIDVDFVGEFGQIVQIEFDCFIAPTEVKNFYNCVYIGRDITARKQAEREIRKSLAREKELRELKSGFISMASHEFRNPLSSILLCVQSLREESSVHQENRDFYLQSIRDAALTMNSLLEDILVLSKAESDKQQLKPEQIQLQVFCQKTIQKLTSIYAGREIELNYLTEQSFWSLDQLTLDHILNNLLSNALKYSSPESVVKLTISSNEKLTELQIEVRDSGIGIPLESQKHLFESFYRAGNVESIPGTGLGLTIVKKSVELYNGSISVDSQPNQGTLISVILPIPID